MNTGCFSHWTFVSYNDLSTYKTGNKYGRIFDGDVMSNTETRMNDESQSQERGRSRLSYLFPALYMLRSLQLMKVHGSKRPVFM